MALNGFFIVKQQDGIFTVRFPFRLDDSPGGLQFLRNTVFQVSPQSKRRIIRGRYQSNMKALHAILSVAHDQHIRVIAYIAPIRDDVEMPYAADEYSRFKRDTESAAVRHGAEFYSLEALVPGEMWGTKQATNALGGLELDFMHFQAKGHQLLADALSDALKPKPWGAHR